MLSATFNPFNQLDRGLTITPVLHTAGGLIDTAPGAAERRERARQYFDFRHHPPPEGYASWDEWRRHAREQDAERERQRKARRAALAPHFKEMDERRAKLHAALEPEFNAYGGRNKWIWHQCHSGRGFQDVGTQIGLHRQRVRQIYEAQERWRIWRAKILPFEKVEMNRGRPIDMGGPRDVWLTFFPSPDPRLDNMEPSNGR